MVVAAQIRQANRHLGYVDGDWRPREWWYGRSASPAALDDLRRRFAAWQARKAVAAAEQSPASTMDVSDHPTLAQRLGAIRAGLVELTRQVDELVAVIEGLER